MWLTLAALLTLCATGRSAENSSESSAVEEKLLIARGKLMVSVQQLKRKEVCSNDATQTASSIEANDVKIHFIIILGNINTHSTFQKFDLQSEIFNTFESLF